MASHSKLWIEPSDLEHVLARSLRNGLGLVLVALAAGALLAWRLATA
jgi:hypothetical protein